MSNETVLTDDEIYSLGVSHDVNGPYSFARAIEQAVLKSPEIQRALQDKARLDRIEAHGGVDITRLSGGDWECDAGSGYGFVEMDRGMRAAIDDAMEKQP